MRVYEILHIYDFVKHMSTVRIRVWVSNSLEVHMEHYPYWRPNDLCPPAPLAPWLFDAPMELVNLDPKPDNIVDLIGTDDYQ